MPPSRCLITLFWFSALSTICASIINDDTAKTWKQEIADRLDKQDYSNPAPLIGVLTQPFNHGGHKSDEQTVSGPLVSWIESAGGRAVPIRYDAPWEEVEDHFGAINGLVLPGGSGDLWYGHPFFDTAARLLALAREANDAGGVFPVFGICLGFETLHILVANRTREEMLVPSEGQEGVSNTIELTRAARGSLFFRRWSDELVSQVGDASLSPTFNAHEWAVPPEAYDQSRQLSDELAVLTTSTDKAGALYVSTVESRVHPFFGTQWHPEKPPYEFADDGMPHTRTAIQAGAATAELLVDIARLNKNKVLYERQVELVINNYDKRFLAPEMTHDPAFQAPDSMWFVPGPRHPRRDHHRREVASATGEATQRLRGLFKGVQPATLANQA